MFNNKYYYKFLHKPYTSSKVSWLSEKNGVFVFKVNKFCNKIQIVFAVENIFKVKVKNIRTLLVKNIIKKKNNIRIKIWKKAYIVLHKDSYIKFNNIKGD